MQPVFTLNFQEPWFLAGTVSGSLGINLYILKIKSTHPLKYSQSGISEILNIQTWSWLGRNFKARKFFFIRISIANTFLFESFYLGTCWLYLFWLFIARQVLTVPNSLFFMWTLRFIHAQGLKRKPNMDRTVYNWTWNSMLWNGLYNPDTSRYESMNGC